VIAAAVATGVRKLVFTSSAGVVFNGEDIIDVDERLPPPERPLDAYNESKAKGEEAVLSANGKGGLLTVALRPASIFGCVISHPVRDCSLNLLPRPGDRQLMSGLYQVYERGQTHFQIGYNTNLFDWTYVTNVARAHLLAADKLSPLEPSKNLNGNAGQPGSDAYSLSEAEENLISCPLPSIDLTTGKFRVPTCEARPLGPYVTLPPNGEKISQTFFSPTPPPSGPVMRSRFDALTPEAVARTKAMNDGLSPLSVSGQAFFITNGEPCYFWDFPRLVWKQLDEIFPEARNPQRNVIVLPKAVGLAAATASEWVGWLVGKKSTFTRFNVAFSCATRWHNVEKARRVLGYEPEVGLEDGVKRMVDVSVPVSVPSTNVFTVSTVVVEGGTRVR
jgi:sterol-4alpha-carboxylate 3-dehydrogenase (decarboxylating)